MSDQDDVQDDEIWDYEDEWDEAPYCDECGSNLVSNVLCFMDGCKDTSPHCPNTWCGSSPHCGEDWI